MLDLFSGVPSVLDCGAEGTFNIKTDWKTWASWGECLGRNVEIGAWIYSIFEDEVPKSYDWIPAAIEYYISSEITPKSTSTSKDELFRITADGSYLYAAFRQAYSINLLDADTLTWREFKALLVSLPDDTKMAQIMAHRAYKKQTKNDIDAQYQKAKQAWALPSVVDGIDIIEIQNKYFGNVK